ncbi:Fibropellin-3,Delta-like protein 4,Adhesive plaque matrix protein 2,Protein jagged-1b,Delta and Notch-like epidermal growth factor-related receptor,Sushi, von Willebrand factor type A, EGF and pentraxin domain-containing protein 1,Neurogenic locus notch homolog protein 1,Delta-like protein D [Mytilus coruscus]|uniref:EGF-like domain-containing protein n=1 Tax=Mytilus coruscus TaxID=42192 RepID=A0A6J8CVM5_MYTCO|nr:Fibropellin-3,Delta-like protein 4,Adhesive plaque matrix protein 2,Protein jagged-1b,Delta and Notch-like epidermal growth factor-related receptor,Sushi, von Willebrand factor type A, EGF and pentraxin domain-containing protein 1,Neurogenic locus notch homolog protein 1,Delta-like protein D [Mytilus coruscus]
MANKDDRVNELPKPLSHRSSENNNIIVELNIILQQIMGITDISQSRRRKLKVAVFVILISTIVFISLFLYFQLKEAPCEDDPCYNGGTCFESGESFGYNGSKCEDSPCSTEPCLNNGTCTVNETPYVCSCQDGYNGIQCKETPCSNHPCLNNGSCEIFGASHVCFCRDGYNGTACEVTPCFGNPCSNRGTCRVSGSSYICSCLPGYTGTSCEVTPCFGDPCLNGGTCSISGSSYVCSCLPGYTGTSCEVTPCFGDPCLNGGTCTDNGSSYMCSCPTGYTGISCEELEFKPIFVACSENQQSVLDTWRTPSTGGEIVNINDSCTAGHLRSSIIDNWNQLGIDKVKVELFTNGKLDLALYFDGNLSTSYNWFSLERLHSSSFSDLTQTSTVNFFSMDGDQTVDRHFYISSNYDGCPGDLFWMVVIDTADANYRPCAYDKLPGKEYPYILYAPDQHKTTLNNGV